MLEDLRTYVDVSTYLYVHNMEKCNSVLCTYATLYAPTPTPPLCGDISKKKKNTLQNVFQNQLETSKNKPIAIP